MSHDALRAELETIRVAARALGGPPAGAADPHPARVPRDPEDTTDPEVTVAMPAWNAARFVGEAMASVLRQEGIRLELVVVDDASTDGTAELVETVGDPRVRLLRNDRHRGIGHGHNRVVEVARAPFIAHVDADDLILQGSLSAMVDALRAEPGAGQAYCDHVAVDAGGSVTRRDFDRQLAFLETRRREHPDIRRGLLRYGMVTNALRTYRRRTMLETVGPFDEDLAFAVDYDMSVRIADRHAMTFVPGPLYVRRLHGGNTQGTMRFRALRSWAQRRRILNRLLAERDGRLLGYDRAGVRRLLLRGLADAIGLGRVKSGIHGLAAR